MPSLGAFVLPPTHPSIGTLFSVWAPEATSVEVISFPSTTADQTATTTTTTTTTDTFPLEKDAATGIFSATVPSLNAGSRYKYLIDGKGPFPDPVSRFQPEGVHGPSEVIDHTTYQWQDSEWKGIESPDKLIIYELHIGTFSKGGTWRSAMNNIPYLKALGVNAIEIMPVSDFAGERNWGYDGVCLYAPAHSYGRPEEFREFVDQCHQNGLAVILDVVYNHFGPEGNYLACYSPYYFTNTHTTPWGPALNVDTSTSSKDSIHATQVRSFLIENAVYWMLEFHVDGLRLDATHAIKDNSPLHFLNELVVTCKDLKSNFRFFAEDERNTVKLIMKSPEGYGLDGVWADDFHHQIRVCAAGDNESYFADFSGSVEDIKTTIEKGWFYTGQPTKVEGKPRGEGNPVEKVNDMSQFVVCIQNHDQVGNRAFGERIHHQINPRLYKCISTLLMTVPATPMLFMGQEWATSSPFQFFTDLTDGKPVTEGRRREFAKFKAFNDPETREKIPDPQSIKTFDDSKLNWDEQLQQEHAAILFLYKCLINLRLQTAAFQNTERHSFKVLTFDNNPHLLCIARNPERLAANQPSDKSSYLCFFNLREESCTVKKSEVVSKSGEAFDTAAWSVVLHTEEQRFLPSKEDAQGKIELDVSELRFGCAGAAIIKVAF